MGKRNKKVRVSLHKNRSKKRRDGDLTRQYRETDNADDLGQRSERVRAKGDVSRKRTVQMDDEDTLAISEEECLRGRVLMTHGLYCTVVTDDGKSHKCYTRRLLKSLSIDERSVVATGDWVWFRPAPDDEGMIVKVDPRTRVLTRAYRNREQIIAANVDQALIVASVAEPRLKPQLIDRYLASSEMGRLEPMICFNKIDLVEAWRLQPFVGLYSQLGYRVLETSSLTGQGIDELRSLLTGRETVIVGQSGVGKSSLLNALEPRLHLKVADVSTSNQKGKHTTTTAQLLTLNGGGSVVDTPGIRQFSLWEVVPEEVERFFVEFGSFAAHCRFPGCTHTHENECAVQDAVTFGYLSQARYDSYVHMLQGDQLDGN